MTDQQHPITPPPELVRKWLEEWLEAGPEGGQFGISRYIATQAARWGADQELEACCKWLASEGLDRFPMRGMLEARRPKPSSLKKQALAKLPEQPENMASHLKLTPGDVATIRRALEALDD